LVLRLGGQPTHDFLDDLLALVACFIFYALLHPPADLLFPYTTLFRSSRPPASVPPSCVPARSARRPCTTSSAAVPPGGAGGPPRSEEHTSELQSRFELVCRLLLEKKNCRIPSAIPSHSFNMGSQSLVC